MIKGLWISVLLLSTVSLLFPLDYKIGLELGLDPVYGTSYFETNQMLAGGTIKDVREGSLGQNFFKIGVFFDATYIQAEVGYRYNLGFTDNRIKDTITMNSGSSNFSTSYTETNTIQVLNIGIVGKYPISVSKNVDIWPAAGLDYDIRTVYVYKNGDQDVNNLTNTYIDYNDFWLKFGLGGDVRVAERIYIVPSLMLAWNLTPNPYRDVDDFKKQFGSSLPVYVGDHKASWSEYRCDFKIGVAYRI